jgi:choline monooxygenase
MVTPYQHEPDLSLAATLPADWYTSAEQMARERERIFLNTWQPVAHLQDVNRPGDYVAAAAHGQPLVIIRDGQGELRAFFNVCQHRAGRLAEGKGNRKTLQCQYHGWTYRLDGSLLRTPEFDGVRNFDPGCFGLKPVPVAAWGPYVFVHLGGQPEPPALTEHLSEIVPETAGIETGRMRLIERRDYVVHCNWKVYIDNYLEGYHIPVAHPGLFRELDYENYRVDTRRWHSRQHSPLRPVAGDGGNRRFAPMSADERVLYYWVWPNFMLNLYPDNLQANLIVPLDTERTLTVFEWFFHDAGDGGAWENVQQSIAFSDQVQKEDIALCEAVQCGLRSRAYRQGRYAVRRENGVHHFHGLVAEALRP